MELLIYALGFATATDARERIERDMTFFREQLADDELRPMLQKLEALAESKMTAKEKLVELKLHVHEIALLAEKQGSETPLISRLFYNFALAFRGISLDAHNKEDDFDTGLEAIRLSIKVSRDVELRAKSEADLATILKNFETWKTANIKVSLTEQEIIVNPKEIRSNSKTIGATDVTGMRFGIYTKSKNGIQTSASYQINVCSDNSYINIECKRWLESEEIAKERFMKILNAMYFGVIPAAVEKITKQIIGGGTFTIGTTRITIFGVYLVKGALMWKKEHLVPWTEVRFGNYNGVLNIRDNANKMRVSYSLRDVWNAVLFESVVKSLQRHWANGS